MFLEGWGSSEGPRIGPKIDFRRSMEACWVKPDCYYFKVAPRSAFLEKGGDRRETEGRDFWDLGLTRETLAKAKVPN